ncbi:HD domain-containing phosphohydrolase [Spirochaetia bacterium 38H-sp]|uniref:HD domain-containing phosphohydrolase n=1 Tax=Rarispira pelagica TaxID=3141764 RepID=A0ABU9UAR2_9SPIR
MGNIINIEEPDEAKKGSFLHIKDLDILLETILTQSRLITNSDAGSIYLKDGNNIKIEYAQNDTLQAQLPRGHKLIYEVFSVPINNKTISGYVANTKKPLLIEDVYSIPSSAPYSFSSMADTISGYKTISMMTMPLLSPREELLGVIQLINPKDSDGNIRAFCKIDMEAVNQLVMSASFALQQAKIMRNIVLKMIKMSQMRDPHETGAHVNRVAAYSVEIYEAWAIQQNIEEKEIYRTKDILRISAMLHDAGKVAISDTILKKPGKLTPEEMEIIKTHTWMGAQLFWGPDNEFEQAAYDISLTHHERWDGSGYPGKVDVFSGKPLSGRLSPLAGEEIPIFGRIVSLADVYDALSSKRSYKEKWPEERVKEELLKMSGKAFDPNLVNIFFNIYQNIELIRKRYPD